jgi:hypothetical protein
VFVKPGSEGNSDRELGYKKRTKPSEFFHVGRVCTPLIGVDGDESVLNSQQVFALLWPEHYGDHGSELSLHDSICKYGKKRMVVVKERHGCCWCMSALSSYSFTFGKANDI